MKEKDRDEPSSLHGQHRTGDDPMSRMTKDEIDAEHCKLTNGLIGHANDHLKRWNSDFVASAIVAASATFAIFNITQNERPCTDADIELAMRNYRRRLETLRSESKEGHACPSPRVLRGATDMTADIHAIRGPVEARRAGAMKGELPSGTLVRMKGSALFLGWVPRGTMGRVVEDPYGIFKVMTEGGLIECCRHEVTVCRDQAIPFTPMRHRLPYGMWTCADGREVLFNRDYKPIWQRRTGGPAEQADADEWVRFERQEWFYLDHNTPWVNKASKRRCEAILQDWGVQ